MKVEVFIDDTKIDTRYCRQAVEVVLQRRKGATSFEMYCSLRRVQFFTAKCDKKIKTAECGVCKVQNLYRVLMKFASVGALVRMILIQDIWFQFYEDDTATENW